MARQARLCRPGHAHLVQLQAVAGASPLATASQRDWFLAWMREGLDTSAVRLHAYAVLPQAVWLLLTPDTAADLSAYVQGLARRTSRAQERAPTAAGSTPPASARAPVWGGRFRSAVIQPGARELQAMVWIDLAADASWPWSSRAAHCGESAAGVPTPALSLPAAYWALGNTPFAREAAYRQRMHQGFDAADAAALMEGLRRGTAIGDAAFLQQIEAETGRRVRPAQRGRPRMKVA